LLLELPTPPGPVWAQEKFKHKKKKPADRIFICENTLQNGIEVKIQLIVLQAGLIVYPNAPQPFRLTIYKVTKKSDTILLEQTCLASTYR